MKKLTVRLYGDPILRQVAAPVGAFDDELEQLAQGMMVAMRTENGIGLAAPQVGVAKRVIVVLQMKEIDDTDASALVMVNPEVLSRSRETWTFEEGCLSLPGVSAPVVRPRAISVSYQNIKGEKKEAEAEGIFARIILHEIDHLQGKLFIDYLSTARRSLVKTKLKNITSGGRPM